jgi:nicotinate phosphoribosyltransferase
MVRAAAGRPLIEGGARRAHESGAVAAARAAYLAGAESTSNLEAGRVWGIPTVGTIGHAFVLAHPSERDAFEAQHALLGSATTYLVDTFDIEVGIRIAVEVAGPELGAIRIDSGDLAVEAKRARTLLDGLGATGTRIIVSGDLDEWSMAALADAPIDGYLVGTNLITGSGHPTASMVYKLVAIEDDSRLRSVTKRSSGKGTVGGRKAAFRADGHEVLVVDNHRPPDQVTGPGRPLQVPLVVDGEVVPGPTLDESRHHCTAALADLPASALGLDGVPPGTRVVE